MSEVECARQGWVMTLERRSDLRHGVEIQG